MSGPTVQTGLPEGADRLFMVRRIQYLAFIASGMMAMSGSLKQALPTSYVPIDLTIGLTLLSLALGGVYVLATGNWPSGRPLAVLTLLLVMALAGTYEYVPSIYGQEKGDRFFAITLLAVVAATLPVKDYWDAYRSIRIIAFVSFGLSLWIALTGQRQYGDGGRLTTQLGSTIAFGRAAGFVLVAVVAWLLTAKNLTPLKLAICVGVIALEIWTMLAIASRGPIQAFLFATLAMIIPQIRRMKLKSTWKALVLFGLLAGALAAVWDTVPDRSQQRIVEVTGSSTSARQFAWDITWRRLDAAPFGNGWGSWARQDDVAGLTYPHSFILEVWFEAGVVGLVALLFILWMAFRHQERVYQADPTAATLITGAIVFWAASAMVSGDVNDNKILWIVLALSVAAVNSTAPSSTAHSSIEGPSTRPPERAPANGGSEGLDGSPGAEPALTEPVSRARLVLQRSRGRSTGRRGRGASAGSAPAG